MVSGSSTEGVSPVRFRPEAVQHLREILLGEADGFDPRCILCAELYRALAVDPAKALTLTQPQLSDEDREPEQVDTGEAFEDGGEDAEQAAEDTRRGSRREGLLEALRNLEAESVHLDPPTWVKTPVAAFVQFRLAVDALLASQPQQQHGEVEDAEQ